MELACRDQIIVALQHVVRDLRHELANVRAEDAYGGCVVELPRSGRDCYVQARGSRLRERALI